MLLLTTNFLFSFTAIKKWVCLYSIVTTNYTPTTRTPMFAFPPCLPPPGRGQTVIMTLLQV